MEIDPRIQQIGVEEHPDQPYQDPRVHRHINDGRAFLRSTDKKYDLVVFALPDSLTLVSQAANVRLESFLFTEQAFKSVADHLNPDDGVFVLYNYYRDPLAGIQDRDDAHGRVRGHQAPRAHVQQCHGGHRGRAARGRPQRRATAR